MGRQGYGKGFGTVRARESPTQNPSACLDCFRPVRAREGRENCTKVLGSAYARPGKVPLNNG